MQMKINPFRPTAPVPPGIFAGRYKELIEIERCLLQTANNMSQHLSITGERGIGKSSMALLTDCYARGEFETLNNNKFHFFTVSTIVKGGQTFQDVLYSLINEFDRKNTNSTIAKFFQKIWDNVDEIGIPKIINIKKRTQEMSLLSDDFNNFLSEFWNNLKKSEEQSYQGIILIIDELDRLKTFDGVASFFKSLFEKFVFDRFNNIMFTIVGMPSMKDNLFNDHQSIPRNFTQLELFTMPENEAKEVICKALESSENKTEIKEDALKSLISISGGYPHFLQELGYSAFEVDEDNIIDSNDVTRGITGTGSYNGSAKRLGNQVFDRMYLKDIQSNIYREILNIMAQEQDEYVSRQKILAKFSKGKTLLGSYLKTLCERNIIKKDAHRLGFYALSSKMFKIYINMLLAAKVSGSL